MKGKPCPLRHIAGLGRFWDTEEEFREAIKCIGDACAWWCEDEACCAVLRSQPIPFPGVAGV